jgi:uncharacterized RDD family membrane protein YckC
MCLSTLHIRLCAHATHQASTLQMCLRTLHIRLCAHATYVPEHATCVRYICAHATDQASTLHMCLRTLHIKLRIRLCAHATYQASTLQMCAIRLRALSSLRPHTLVHMCAIRLHIRRCASLSTYICSGYCMQHICSSGYCM